MKRRQWYGYLMEHELSVINPHTNENEQTKCKADIKRPDVD